MSGCGGCWAPSALGPGNGVRLIEWLPPAAPTSRPSASGESKMLYAKGRLTLDRPFQTWLQEAASPAVVQIMPLDVSMAILPTS